jgi:hypothetical protein
MKKTIETTDCKTCREHLAELLLDDAFAAEHLELAAHMKGCGACSQELAELRATFALLDHWTAPEPTPYFDAKVHVGLREAVAAAPEGLWERMRSFMLFSTGRALRPAMAAALAVLMVAGGGGVMMGVYPRTAAVQASPAVNDLRILDNNAQALQQMDQLLDDSSNTEDGSGRPTT